MVRLTKEDPVEVRCATSPQRPWSSVVGDKDIEALYARPVGVVRTRPCDREGRRFGRWQRSHKTARWHTVYGICYHWCVNCLILVKHDDGAVSNYSSRR